MSINIIPTDSAKAQIMFSLVQLMCWGGGGGVLHFSQY